MLRSFRSRTQLPGGRVMQSLGGRRAHFAALLLAFVGPWLAPAQSQTLGPEFQVNSYTTGLPEVSRRWRRTAGGFVVAWAERRPGRGRLRRVRAALTAGGQAMGMEFQVNSYTTGRQNYPAVAADGPGNFVVAWSSPQDGSSDGVFGQRYDSAGTPIRHGFSGQHLHDRNSVHAEPGGEARGPSWCCGRATTRTARLTACSGSATHRRARRSGRSFRSTPTPPDTRIEPAVAGADGDFVVAWESQNQDGGSGYGVFGQRYESAGAAAGREFQVNSYTTGDQIAPGVAADGGAFVVAWNSRYQDGSSWGVFGQRYDGGAGGGHGVSGQQLHDRLPARAGGGGGRGGPSWWRGTATPRTARTRRVRAALRRSGRNAGEGVSGQQLHDEHPVRGRRWRRTLPATSSSPGTATTRTARSGASTGSATAPCSSAAASSPATPATGARRWAAAARRARDGRRSPGHRGPLR